MVEVDSFSFAYLASELATNFGGRPTIEQFSRPNMSSTNRSAFA